jgi:hypothetical protein
MAFTTPPFSRALFELKMKMATAEIKETIENSTEKILLRVSNPSILTKSDDELIYLQLDDGPHDLIEDPDIRTVWKGTQFFICTTRVSFTVRNFVDMVYIINRP